MPCACRTPVINYPDNVDWGPLFWKLLHGLAEYAGKQNDSVLRADEIRQWIQMIRALATTLPCDKCRFHQSQWLTSHPIQNWDKIPQTEFNLTLRKWYLDLHNDVNSRLGKPIFPLEGLSQTQSNLPLRQISKQLEPVMLKAIQLSGVTLLNWKKWLQCYRSLQAIYGV